MEIIDYLGCGVEEAKPLHTIMAELNISDRQARLLLESARRKHCIINLQDGLGYYMPRPQDVHIVRRYIAQERARARSITSALRGARLWLAEHEEGEACDEYGEQEEFEA